MGALFWGLQSTALAQNSHSSSEKVIVSPSNLRLAVNETVQLNAYIIGLGNVETLKPGSFELIACGTDANGDQISTLNPEVTQNESMQWPATKGAPPAYGL
ncbi:MAG: hypothetical protein U5J63_08920 [Fodinibius sp.]|nr:hypothetical protein [Fodinibius sp.]